MDDRRARKTVKCLVWDLDDTLWQGTLLNGGARELRDDVVAIVKELDARGILQSVASKNDHEVAWPLVEAFGLSEYFLHPQISWDSKADSVRAIAETLGIGLDTVAFIDDQAAERDEVAFYLPQVRVIDALELAGLLDRPEFRPDVITDETRMRRVMYRTDIARTEAEKHFTGTRDAFLITLGMRMTIRPAREGDLRRAEELTLRTNQLNTTGLTYSYQELEDLSRSPDHLLLVATLEDRYGSSGTIGLALVETGATAWTIRLLIMSCRVITRGVGTVLLGHLLRRAADAGVRLQAAFVHTDRNRQMYIAYKFAGFVEVSEDTGGVLLEHGLKQIHPLPAYVQVISDLDEEVAG
ncbi:HAD-IIIC family phosphatase [Trinickia fusca]|uniref:HAD-IIIC family phosphatase n=1 Tax=Trinickia fusca TaxID=2419777 RepID=UPI001FE7AAAA|nr:HAD-IIIC family phosphatase [Trinickia fusca]